MKPAYYLSARKAQVRGRILKLNPIQASVISKIPWSSALFRENPVNIIVYMCLLTRARATVRTVPLNPKNLWIFL